MLGSPCLFVAKLELSFIAGRSTSYTMQILTGSMPFDMVWKRDRPTVGGTAVPSRVNKMKNYHGPPLRAIWSSPRVVLRPRRLFGVTMLSICTLLVFLSIHKVGDDAALRTDPRFFGCMLTSGGPAGDGHVSWPMHGCSVITTSAPQKVVPNEYRLLTRRLPWPLDD